MDGNGGERVRLFHRLPRGPRGCDCSREGNPHADGSGLALVLRRVDGRCRLLDDRSLLRPQNRYFGTGLMAPDTTEILTEKWETEEISVGLPSRFGNRALDTHFSVRHLSVKCFSPFF